MTKKKEIETKPAAGTIKEEPTEAKAVTPGGNGQQRPQGLQAMSEKDVNEYMASLIETQQPPAGMVPLEIGALAQFRGISQESGNVERRLTRSQAEVEQLKSQLSRLQGQSEAYVNVLVLAEDSRRAEPEKLAEA